MVRYGTPDANAVLEALCGRGLHRDEMIESTVRAILSDVASKGDEAVLDYTERFDGIRLSADEMELPFAVCARAHERVHPQLAASLRTALERIRSFHLHQRCASWEYTDAEGVLLGQKVTPLERVGVYVPGGKAAYPSSVLMNTIPAKIAGVREVIMVTPPAGILQNTALLCAASLSGIDRIFRIGGAQAIAALAFGTEHVPKVDKIVGPGNVFVETAKRMVFGTVDIDMTAGPSEILIISDGTSDARYLAADLLAQAEHDERARPILVTTSQACAELVISELQRQLTTLPTARIAAQALATGGVAVIVDDLDQAVALSNAIAPEHLELAVRDPGPLLEKICNAGAVFVGTSTPETIGDYLAGPNHVLPTGGTSRWFSPLGVYDFVKRTNFVKMDIDALRRLGPAAACIARAEGLEAHARAVEARIHNHKDTK